MVRDTVAHLRAEGQRVFLDAEHFFDGYRANRDYALEVLRTAYDAGAEVVALCDTNGGMLPGLGRPTSSTTSSRPPACGSASTATTTPAARSPTRWPPSTPAPPTCRARSTATASAPATPTWSRSSPTSSSSSAGRCCPTGLLREATRIAHAVAEVTNFPPASRQPYVGTSRVRAQGRAARQRDQGRPEPLPAHGPGAASATTCGCWSPTWPAAPRSSSRAASWASTSRGDQGAGHPDHRPGQGAGVARLHLRGRRRVVRAAAASRRSRAPGRRTSRSSRGGSSPRPSPATRRSPRRPSSCAPSGVRYRRHRRGQRPGQRARPGAARRRSGRPTRRSRSSS